MVGGGADRLEVEGGGKGKGQRLDQAKADKHAAITICRGFTHGDYGPRELDRAMRDTGAAAASAFAGLSWPP